MATESAELGCGASGRCQQQAVELPAVNVPPGAIMIADEIPCQGPIRSPRGSDSMRCFRLAARKSSQMPRCWSEFRISGESTSPALAYTLRRSRSTTSRPSDASVIATAAPAGPLPKTTASAIMAAFFPVRKRLLFLPPWPIRRIQAGSIC